MAIALAFAVPGCSQPQQQPEAKQTEPSGPVHSRGVVYAVTREENAITIQHEAIPEYGMPPMVMEFTVDDPADLEGIEAGDAVAFELRSALDIASISEVAGN